MSWMISLLAGWGFLMVDAINTFDSIDHVSALLECKGTFAQDAIYRFTFNTYRGPKGTLNGNADAWSRRLDPMTPWPHEIPCSVATAVQTNMPMEEIRCVQQQDDITKHLLGDLKATNPLSKWRRWQLQPWRRYAQIWSHLAAVDGVVCRRYTPDPAADVVTVPVLPKCLQPKALFQCHDHPAAGHQGYQRTLHRLWQQAYWVSMAQDVERTCRECQKCQSSKLCTPTRAPLHNLPFGRPWQMVAIDILQVPVSTNNNKYLLVMQDYFTKWADAKPIKDPTAAIISAELVKLFCTYGIPELSTLIRVQTLKVPSLSKLWRPLEWRNHTLHHIILREMAWLSSLINLYCSCYVHTLKRERSGKSTYP